MINVPLFVGTVANSWARLEYATVPLAKVLLQTKDKKVAKIVMFAANPVARRDLISALNEASPLSPAHKQEIEDWCVEYDRLRVLRNDIVHGRWDHLTKAGQPILRTAKSRESLKEKAEEKTIKWIMKAQSDIEALIGRTMQMCLELPAP
jgi:hypothetical protein